MGRKELNKFGKRTFTVQELCEIIPQLNGTRQEAIEIGNKHGLNPRYVDWFRSLVGFSDPVPPPKTQEEIDKVIKCFEDHPDESAYQLFIKYNKELHLNCYQQFYAILRKHGIEGNRKRDYWTPIKDKQLLYLRDTKKYSYPMIAKIMEGKTVNALQFRYYKLEGIISPSKQPKRNKKAENEN